MKSFFSYLKDKKAYWAGGVIIFFFVLPTLFLTAILAGFYGPVPGAEELRKIHHHEASTVYSSDGEILGTYFYQNRKQVELDDISPSFISALQSIEDIRYFEHNGIDARAVLRVVVKSLLLGQDTGGGSTLSQQLAKNLYPRDYSTHTGFLADKIREMMIARRLENVYTKDELLVLYLNSVSFGEETFGLETASMRFFSKPPADLKIQESALLAALLKAPSYYNPRVYPERALQRRNLVLSQMEKYGMLTPSLSDSLRTTPLELNYRKMSGSDGLAPYFRDHLRQELHVLLDTLESADGRTYNLYRDGLQIETTINSKVQAAAEQAMQVQMKQLQTLLNEQIADSAIFSDNDPALLRAWRNSSRYQTLADNGIGEEQINQILHTPTPTSMFTWEGEKQQVVTPYDSLRHYNSLLNSGILAMNPENGTVLAWVGGIDHHHFQYDHVKSKRQAGSAFKPIVYSAALESGMEPCSWLPNRRVSYVDYDNWTPRNSSDEYGGYYTLQGGLVHSVNTVSVDLMMKTGIEPVRRTAAALGIGSPVPNEPSVALGVLNVSLLEMVTAYSAFINAGTPAIPNYLRAIRNSDGEIIYEAPENSATGIPSDDILPVSTSGEIISRGTLSAISPETAATITAILARAVKEGTGSSLQSLFGLTRPLAGKTGTTQNNSDGWFMGMTPEMVFGIWIGGSTPRVRIRGNAGYASATALPVAGHFLTGLSKYPEWAGSDGFAASEPGTASYAGIPLACSDYKGDTFGDKLKQFFTGRSSEDTIRVNTTKEKTNIFKRIGNLFK